MSRKGVRNRTRTERKFTNPAQKKACATCGEPIKHGGYPDYCSRYCYLAAFAKYKKFHSHLHPMKINSGEEGISR